MKLLRLGQTLCEGVSPPPPVPPDAFFYLKRDRRVSSDFDLSCTPISSGTPTVDGQPVTVWRDSNGGVHAAEQVICADCPTWNLTYKYIHFDATQYFNLTTTYVMSGAFTYYMKVTFESLSSPRALLGNDSSNFFRISNPSTFRVRMLGTPNWDFTEVSDTISEGLVSDEMYIAVLSRDASGYLSMFIDGGPATGNQYNDKSWGSTTHQDTDYFPINNIGAKEDDVQNFSGWMSDVIFFYGHHTATERQQVYNYI